MLKKCEFLQKNNMQLNQNDIQSTLDENIVMLKTSSPPPKVEESNATTADMSASIDEVCNFKQSDEIKCLHDEINEKNKVFFI